MKTDFVWVEETVLMTAAKWSLLLGIYKRKTKRKGKENEDRIVKGK